MIYVYNFIKGYWVIDLNNKKMLMNTHSDDTCESALEQIHSGLVQGSELIPSHRIYYIIQKEYPEYFL